MPHNTHHTASKPPTQLYYHRKSALATTSESAEARNPTLISNTPKQQHNFHPQLLPIALVYTLKSHQEDRMAAVAYNGVADVPADHPADGNRVGTQAWFEPWLIKHSKFYRKHFTKHGDGMTGSERRQSMIAEDEDRIRQASGTTDESTSTAAGKAPEQPAGV